MWYFYSPSIIYGEDSIDFLGNITGEKCFIVTDETIEKLGYLKILTDKLEKFGKTYEIFKDVIPDPHEEGVIIAREQCISYGPDLIIALGGGSVIDTAKTVWALYEFPDFTIDDVHTFNNKLYEIGKRSKFIAIPTTSGTGSETTNAAIISRLENDIWKKFIYTHKGLTPTYAIVDPKFPLGMPSKLTADTGFDALSHAIEAMVSNWRNEFSYAIGLKSIELVFKYLPIAYKDGDNKEARDFLHQAATMAGLAFSNSQLHIGHGMGHSWGAVFNTAHGRAVGIVLPYVTQFLLNSSEEGDKTIEIYGKMAKQLGWANWDEEEKKAALLVIDKIKELQKKVNFPTKLKDLGISREDLEKNLDSLVSCCFEDATVVMSPRSITDDYFRKLFDYAFEGKDVDF